MAGVLTVFVGVACSPTGSPPAPGARIAAAAPTGDPWADLKAAAVKEGEVVITGTLTPDAAQALGDGFRTAYGIDVAFEALDTGSFEARADREFKANAVSIDAAFGVSNCYIMADRGEIQDFTGVLIEPDALDPAAWANGAPRLFVAMGDNIPAGFTCGSQFGTQVQPQLFTNPTVIAPGTITSWNDLLQPAYKGKIASHDPRIGGGGQGTAISIMYILGEDFFKQLYLGQDVTLTRDYRQLADWVAQGEYPIAMGISDDIVAGYRAQGLPIERTFPSNGPDALTAGSGAISLLKNSPHPNAAKLFANWLHTREGQMIWELHAHTPSLRTDTTRDGVVPWVVPQADVSYKLHDGDPAFYYQHRAPIVNRIQDLLGR